MYVFIYKLEYLYICVHAHTYIHTQSFHQSLLHRYIGYTHHITVMLIISKVTEVSLASI